MNDNLLFVFYTLYTVLRYKFVINVRCESYNPNKIWTASLASMLFALEMNAGVITPLGKSKKAFLDDL